ncbi:MAG: PaaI family thioesterase [Actinomycetota bacterium]
MPRRLTGPDRCSGPRRKRLFDDASRRPCGTPPLQRVGERAVTGILPRIMPLDPELLREIQSRAASSEFHRWMGTQITGIDEGSCEMTLALAPHHLNPGGIVHGGVIASLLDSAIGLALRTRLWPGSRHATLQLGVHYIAMARTGTLTARGSAVHSGSRTGFGEATLHDEAGKLIAKASATFMIVPGTPGDPGAPR